MDGGINRDKNTGALLNGDILMEKKELLISTNGPIATLTLNRPDQRNTLTPKLLAGIHLTLEKWAAGDTIRTVVVTGGSGPVFSAGYDIGAISMDADPENSRLLKKDNPFDLALSSIRNFPYPVIAMLNGHAFGGGLNLAIACDIRIGVDDIKAGMPPARLGLVYPPAGLQQFVEVLGMARTREVFLTGKTYCGLAVKSMGLVDHLVPREALAHKTYDLAAEIAGNAPLAIKGIKKLLNMLGDRMTLDAAVLGKAEKLVATALNSEDLKEGRRAFMDKRKPAFKGY